MSQWPLGQGRLQVDGGLCGSTSHIIDDGGCFWNRDGPGEGGKAIMSTTCRVRVTGPVDVLVGQYRGYLVSERVLTPQVVAAYVRLAREFLAAACGQPGGPGLAELAAAFVTDYVVAGCRGRRPGSGKSLVTGLRSLL